MKILFVSPYLPSPARFGGQRRIEGLMRGLAKQHELSIMSFNSTDAYTQESVDATAAYCKTVLTLPDLDPRSVSEKRKLQMRLLLSAHSFEHLQVKRRPDFQRLLDEQLSRERYDVVQVEFANMAAYRFTARDKRSRLVLDEHNVEYDLQRRTSKSAEGLSRRVYNSLNWRKYGYEEKAAWRRFDGVVLTSKRDRELLAQTSPATRASVVPNGVDVDQFQPSVQAVEPETLLFFGANNYFPNHDGLLYFIDEILPKLVARRPNLKLSIVGLVDDLMPHLERATAVVVPLRIGGGTRLKIVEAMAKSKAIVSTSVGAEGIEVTHGKDVLLADTPNDFASQVLSVLDDPALASRLGHNARRLAEDRYAWSAVVRNLEAFYTELQRP